MLLAGFLEMIFIALVAALVAFLILWDLLLLYLNPQAMLAAFVILLLAVVAAGSCILYRRLRRH